MADRDFEIGSRKFKLNKIDTFKQFHIVRRLGPILGEIIPAAKGIAGLDETKMTEEQKFDFIAKLATPVMDGFSKLSDKDADFVLLSLCSAVEMQQSLGNWARVATDAGLMFQDIELPLLLQIAGRAFMYNVAGFFSLMPQVSPGPK